jgi:hypothetical protein
MTKHLVFKTMPFMTAGYQSLFLMKNYTFSVTKKYNNLHEIFIAVTTAIYFADP